MFTKLARRIAPAAVALAFAGNALGTEKTGVAELEATPTGVKTRLAEASVDQPAAVQLQVSPAPKAAAREPGMPIIGAPVRSVSTWGRYKPSMRKSRNLERFPGID